MSKPATYSCQDCEITYDMGAETCCYIFQRQPWLNYLVTTCPKCETTWYVWFVVEETIQYMEANNMPEGDEINWAVEDFASDAIVRQFAFDNNLPAVAYEPPRIYRSSRAEIAIDREVAFWAWELKQLPTRRKRNVRIPSIPLQRTDTPMSELPQAAD